METEKNASAGLGNKLHDAIAAAPQGAALGETVKAGLDRAGARVKDTVDHAHDTLADCGAARTMEDLAENVRRHPMTALVIATGVGMFVGMLLVTRQTPRSP